MYVYVCTYIKVICSYIIIEIGIDIYIYIEGEGSSRVPPGQSTQS